MDCCPTTEINVDGLYLRAETIKSFIGHFNLSSNIENVC